MRRSEANLVKRSADFQSAVSPISNRQSKQTSHGFRSWSIRAGCKPAIQQIENLRDAVIGLFAISLLAGCLSRPPLKRESFNFAVPQAKPASSSENERALG